MGPRRGGFVFLESTDPQTQDPDSPAPTEQGDDDGNQLILSGRDPSLPPGFPRWLLDWVSEADS